MSNFIPQEKIDEIRNAASIVDVVSQYVVLKKAGRNFVGLCPFHGEKDPSFTVSSEKQIFHCFGCGQGGNVFNFLMLYHNIGFPEAIQQLGQKYGIQFLTSALSPDQKREIDERKNLYNINKEACQYFRRSLDGPEGHIARAYLSKRKIGKDIIEKFSLGFASKSWENLVRFFISQGTSLTHAEKAGLIIGKKGGFYDRFRFRVVFPIEDIHGRILGFGGRSLDDSLPKYLNSPETPLYHKGRVLYGLGSTKDACRRANQAFVVEGYFDLLSLYGHGIENVVATLGTALTAEHVRILKGYAERIVLVFDSDEAGIKAAERSLPLFAKEKVDAHVLTLPDGHDPDTFVIEFGGKVFHDLSLQANGMVEFLIESTIKRYGLSLQGKLKVMEALEGPLRSLTDGITRSVYVKYLAERLDIDESAVLDKVRGSIPARRQGAVISDGEKDGPSKLEETLVAMMLRFPELLSSCDIKNLIDRFQTKFLREIGKMIIAEGSANCESIGSSLIARSEDPKLRNVIASLSMRKERCGRDGFLAVIRQYQNHLEKKNKQSLSKKIKEAEKAKNEDLVFELLAEKQRRIRKRNGTTV